VLAAAVSVAAAPSQAQHVASIGSYEARLDAYTKAHRAYDAQASAYWDAIAEKRRIRFAKRRHHEPVALTDYVLTQPPVYSGPPRPPDMPKDDPGTRPPRAPIPLVADFLRSAAEHHRFVPQRPNSDLDFKRAYARAAKASGLTRDQVVRIYAFETGGNGTYDVQSGLTHPRPGARAISTAVGYNQLLTTNSVSLLAQHGDHLVNVLRHDGAGEHKLGLLRHLTAFKVSRKLRVGSLWINDASRFRLDTYPFGGVGSSGFGREGVRYAMEELSQWKFTGMRVSP
jgi:hypothetical protein